MRELLRKLFSKSWCREHKTNKIYGSVWGWQCVKCEKDYTDSIIGKK